MKLTKNRIIKGFSLIEIILGMGLFSILMVTVNMTLFDSLKSARRTRATDVVKNEGNRLISQMAKDIEFSTAIDAPDCSLDTDEEADTIVLRVGETGTLITYQFNFTNGLLTRRVGTNTAVRVSSPSIALNRFPAECNTAGSFVCNKQYVTICFGANLTDVGIDASDMASASSDGLKFYSRVIRRNNF